VADAKQMVSDVPLGLIGKLMGLRVVPPELEAGEEVVWSKRANRFQNRLRAVGGRLFLTDHRLIFGRSKLERLLGGKEWSAPLSVLVSASTTESRLKVVRIEKADGGTDRFRIPNADQSAAVIDAAIKEANSAAPRSS
jgi:hypothetical protein